MYIDTHLDTVWHVGMSKRSFTEFKGEASEDKMSFGPGISLPRLGHVDLPRARKGGLVIGFFTGFPSSSHYTTEKMVRDWIIFMEKPEHMITRIKTKKELDQFISSWRISSFEEKRIGSIFSLEGAAGIDTELNRLFIYYDIGLRSLGLTWNEQNQFATGVGGKKERGLTKEGKDLLNAAENLGIIIDVSHLNDKSFWDVIDNSNSNIIASHSNLREQANHPRNLTKEMAKAIADSGGSIGLNLHSGFLKPDNPKEATINTAINMLQAMIEIAGINHVHIGSDFDGSTPPKEIKDVSYMPIFFEKIKETLSLNEKELRKIQYENIVRIIKNVWSK